MSDAAVMMIERSRKGSVARYLVAACLRSFVTATHPFLPSRWERSGGTEWGVQYECPTLIMTLMCMAEKLYP